MNKKIVSEGVCVLCDKTYKKSGINRHLKTHLAKLDKPTRKADSSFLLKIEANPRYYGKTGYFLYLWIDGKTTIEELDEFLRDIWLECCGHLSSFIDMKKREEDRKLDVNLDFDFFDEDRLSPGELDKNKIAKKSLHKGQKIYYTYDFGSSTELLISVEESYKSNASEKIVLLSRNEPLNIVCDTCGEKSAEVICTVHGWDEDTLFCKKCAKKHAKKCKDFKDYAEMPVVNSPRFGVCGYEGGCIDVERDGNTK